MKRYEITLICLLLCLCMNAQEFEPKEYNGMLYQELASHVIDKEDAALVIYLHGRHASGNDKRKQLKQAFRPLPAILKRITFLPIFSFLNVRKTESGMDVTAKPDIRTVWRT